MCSASFPLCFSSPTRTGLVSPIPEWNLVILRRHSSFAVCFQASTLSNFLRYRCHQTSTAPVSMPPTYPETTIHPSQWAAQIRWAILYCLISTCFLRILGTLLLARFLLPFIFSISNYLCPDRLFWLGFFFSSSYLAPKTCTFDKWVNGAYVVCKFRNAIVGPFSFFKSYFNQVLGISVHLNAWPHNDSFF